MSTLTNSQPVTFDDVMRFFAESRATFQEEMRLWREESERAAERRSAEMKEAETKRIAEMKEAETKRIAEMKEAEAKRIAEMKEAEAKSEREMQALRAELGKLGNRLGDFVQEMVKPAAVRLFQQRGLPVHRVMSNMKYLNDDRQSILEVELFVINGTVGILIECKSNASIDDVNEHLERLEKFRVYFAEYHAITLHAAIAAMVMPDEVARYAYKKGMFVMAQNGDSIDIKNDDKFMPKTW